ncbi:MAG: hypothetical protein PQJ58_11965 [Spirochaetales bacterium]|nr:hypothetical protein [Spirochaetales bacterium]
MNLKHIFVLFYLSSLILTGCDPDADGGGIGGGDDVSLTMDFANSSAGAGVFLPGASRTAVGDPYIGNFTLFNQAYDDLGDIVQFDGSDYLSPSSFVLPFTQAALGNGSSDITLSVPVHNYDESEWDEVSNVDFCDPITYDIEGVSNGGTYDTLFIRISSTQRTLGYDSGVIWQTPVLEVTVPGYTDSDWPDSYFESEGRTIYMRRYLGGNKFMFDLSQVLPNIKDSSNQQASAIENYMFCSDYSDAGVVLPGLEGFPDMIDTSEFGNVGSSSNTNLSMLIFPFEEVVIEGETTLTFIVETENLLSVYDNNSPGDKSDDVLKLVPDFYNHFIVVSE